MLGFQMYKLNELNIKEGHGDKEVNLNWLSFASD